MGGTMGLMLPDYRVHRFTFGDKEKLFRTFRGLNQHLEKLNNEGWVFISKSNARLTRRKIIGVYQLENKNVQFIANKDDQEKVCKIVKLKILN